MGIWRAVGEPQANGIPSPFHGRHTHSEWWSCVSSETTRKRKKRSEPRRQEWAAEGVVSIYCIAFCHPDLRRGSGIFLGCTSGSARHADACRAPPLAMDMSPCRALNSSGLQPDKFQFIERFFSNDGTGVARKKSLVPGAERGRKYARASFIRASVWIYHLSSRPGAGRL